MWEVTPTWIKDLCVLTPFCVEDNRGSFIKLFEKDIYAKLGMPNDTNEIFVSHSRPGVLRGMHFQFNNPQTKYVSVLKGTIYDVAVDLRKDSPSFGKWNAVELSEKNGWVYCIPKGFAHGFQVLGDSEAIVVYQCSGKYDKESDVGILWNDPDIAIHWPHAADRVVSERDARQMTFLQFKENIGGI